METTIPALVFLSALLVAGAMFLKNQLVYRPVPYLATAGAPPMPWPTMPAAAPALSAQPRKAPSRPEDWLARDISVSRIVVVAQQAVAVKLDKDGCRCGGAWRYTLGEAAGLPLWRCLHCGGLHAGADPIPQA